MHFSNIIALSFPILGAMAAPTPDTSASSQSSGAFGVISARSASPIHLLPMNAAGFRFFLGGKPSTYCPPEVVENCPAGNTTAFASTCAMDVNVPGGQQVYLTSTGELGYTQAHSASIPEGAVQCPLVYTKDDASAAYGRLSLDPAVAFGATGFMACPTSSGKYQVFASIENAVVPSGNVADCLGFSALAPAYTNDGPAAWQYA